MNELNSRSEDGIDVALALDTTAHLFVNGSQLRAVVFGDIGVIIVCDEGRYVLSQALYDTWLGLALDYGAAQRRYASSSPST